MKIIFVHLGRNPARHLWKNIRQLRQNFPNRDIYLLLDNKIHERKLRKLGCHTIFVEPEEIFGLELTHLSHNKDFRNGFWTYSIQRFYALSWFHAMYPSERIIHFESDILVLPNFPWHVFEQLESCSWPKFNDASDAASVFFSPSSQCTQELLDTVREHLVKDNTLTDMTVLSKIHSSNPEKYPHLPTSPINLDNRQEKFGGIFDAAPIGMWLTGRDPRNHLGFIKRFLDLPEAEFDVARYQLMLRRGNLEFTNNEKRQISVFNLHIHSKRIVLFSHFWETFLALDIYLSRNKLFKNSFSPYAFISVIYDYLKRNKLSNILTYKKLFSRIINTNGN